MFCRSNIICREYLYTTIISKIFFITLTISIIKTYSILWTIIQTKYFWTIISSPFIFFKTPAISKRKVLNAFSNRHLSRYIATIIQTSFQTAILSIISIRLSILINTFACLCVSITFPILTAMWAILNFNSVNVYKAQTIWTIFPFTSKPMISILTCAPRNRTKSIATAISITLSCW